VAEVMNIRGANLDELKKQIEEEEARRAKLEAAGLTGLEMDIDLTAIEDRLSALVINGNNQVKLLERLNVVSDNIYAKLEELSLKLLQLAALGLPLLQKAQ
jgi:hypothetical protein